MLAVIVQEKLIYLQGLVQELVHLHDGGLIATSIAIIRRREYCDDIHVVRPIAPIHNQLMRARYQRQPIALVEHFGYIGTKSISCASRGNSPTSAIIRYTQYQRHDYSTSRPTDAINSTYDPTTTSRTWLLRVAPPAHGPTDEYCPSCRCSATTLRADKIFGPPRRRSMARNQTNP
jgi:hypothetical protein